MPFESTASSCAAMDALKRRLSGFESEDGRRRGLAFRPRPSDVLVTTTPKAGTTLMQQLCHQLRAGGDESFGEISDEGVVPWIELAADCGIDLEAPQPAEPRIFKTHCWQPHCPKGGKNIVVVRDPVACASSFYHFFEGWFFSPGEVGIDEFVRDFVLARGAPESDMQNASYWHHLISWWPRRAREDVLLVSYEGLVADREGHVRRVAEFILPKEVLADQEEVERRVAAATEMTSLEWMQEHPTMFDEHITKLKRNASCGLSPDAGFGGGKVRAKGAKRAAMSAEVLEEVHAKWREVVEPATGLASYEELLQALASGA